MHENVPVLALDMCILIFRKLNLITSKIVSLELYYKITLITTIVFLIKWPTDEKVLVRKGTRIATKNQYLKFKLTRLIKFLHVF